MKLWLYGEEERNRLMMTKTILTVMKNSQAALFENEEMK
jgi:hypothetical protein